MLTQRRLKELLHYNPLTGIFTNKVDRNPRALSGMVAGANSHGYITIQIDKASYGAHRLVFLYVDGYIPEGNVEHEDRVRSNNRYSNLRPDVDQKCNMRNIGNREDNKSGVKGVSRDTKRDCWRARVMIDQKEYHIGASKSFTEAVFHRYAIEQCLNWSWCETRSPAYLYLKERGLIQC